MNAAAGIARIMRSIAAASVTFAPEGIANTTCRTASSARMTRNAVPSPAT
jgi:hypothetical protein